MNGAGQIKVVVMDMSRQYRCAVEEALPQAMIVVDRFHLERMANEAVDCARIRLNKALRKAHRGAEICSAAPLRKPSARLKGREKTYLDEWFVRSPVLQKVYERKEEFRRMWECAPAAEAKRFYEEWLLPFAKKAPDTEEDKQVRKDFKELHSAMGNWGKYIYTYFDLDRKPTNAFTEWANRRIRDVLRESRGCGVDVIRAKLIFGTWMRRRMKEGVGRWGESTVVMARTRRPSEPKPKKNLGAKKPKKSTIPYRIRPTQPSLFQS